MTHRGRDAIRYRNLADGMGKENCPAWAGEARIDNADYFVSSH